MEYLKGYRVKFDTKKGGLKTWVIDIFAKNKAEARRLVESYWYDSGRGEHMFHIEVFVLTKISFDYAWFSQV